MNAKDIKEDFGGSVADFEKFTRTYGNPRLAYARGGKFTFTFREWGECLDEARAAWRFMAVVADRRRASPTRGLPAGLTKAEQGRLADQLLFIASSEEVPCRARLMGNHLHLAFETLWDAIQFVMRTIPPRMIRVCPNPECSSGKKFFIARAPKEKYCGKTCKQWGRRKTSLEHYHRSTAKKQEDAR